jgi:hypothetical protein
MSCAFAAEDANEVTVCKAALENNCRVTVVRKFIEFEVKKGQASFSKTPFTLLGDNSTKDKVAHLLSSLVDGKYADYCLLVYVDDGKSPYVVSLDSAPKELMDGFIDKRTKDRILDVKVTEDATYILYTDLVRGDLRISLLFPDKEFKGCGLQTWPHIFNDITYVMVPENGRIVLIPRQDPLIMLTSKGENKLRLYSMGGEKMEVKLMTEIKLDAEKK